MLSASMLMCGLAERAFRPHPEARRLLCCFPGRQGW
jgi:hypothetical protein